MFKNRFPYLRAALQALLVTFLWSTSFVLVKMGLKDIPALTFAGLRYSLAFLCLLPVVLRPARLTPLRSLPGRKWVFPLSLVHWAIIGWLAVVNTAFAFTLWNHTLRTLSAMESSIINNTMLVQVAILAWLFLGEQLTWRGGIGMVLVGLGALIVQIRLQSGRSVAEWHGREFAEQA